eukprot:NODE_623_length_5907_cov_0.380165.p3 type:complete len:130 gc:universal NODE_623_length_5907_cov_0.380165:2035-2424(+)
MSLYQDYYSNDQHLNTEDMATHNNPNIHNPNNALFPPDIDSVHPSSSVSQQNPRPTSYSSSHALNNPHHSAYIEEQAVRRKSSRGPCTSLFCCCTKIFCSCFCCVFIILVIIVVLVITQVPAVKKLVFK